MDVEKMRGGGGEKNGNGREKSEREKGTKREKGSVSIAVLTRVKIAGV
jgi:hypothetical protein